MSTRVNPGLPQELRHYGKGDWNECFHCGNCTAVCPLTADGELYPRKVIRNLQMGLTDKLAGSLEPWLCYYCGECSTKCPRGAEPGELMMTMRRWLTAQYDFTGISKLFYRSWKVELSAVLLLALLTAAGFLSYGFYFGGRDFGIYDGPGAFLPSSAVHIFDWIMGGTLACLLGVNALRMWWFAILGNSGPQPGVGAYVKNLFALPWHFFTQKRYAECDEKSPWVLHLILMLSYFTMLILIMVFLHKMQEGPDIAWSVHSFGYLASIGLLITCILAIRGRLRKQVQHHKHSHESDWIFLILLSIVTATGILQHILHRAGLPLIANLMYIIHMMGVVPMLVLEVPFSKWSHMAYRPMAMYFASLKRTAAAPATL